MVSKMQPKGDGGGGRRYGGQGQGRQGAGYNREGQQGRSGDGNERGGRGYGPMDPRANTWKRKDGEEPKPTQGGTKGSKAQAQDDSKWEAQEYKEVQETQWKNQAGAQGSSVVSKPTATGESEGFNKEEGNPKKHSHPGNLADHDTITPCGFCGYTNHATKDCHRARCIICGSNHTVIDCPRLVA